MHVACTNSGDVQLHLVTCSGQYQRTRTAHLERRKEKMQTAKSLTTQQCDELIVSKHCHYGSSELTRSYSGRVLAAAGHAVTVDM
jgi:hypothetical protein